MELRGRWALVTGAARRVGRVVALELAGRGANIVVHYNTSADEAGATVADLRALGVDAHVVQADLADAAQVRRLADDAEARSGGVAARQQRVELSAGRPSTRSTNRRGTRASTNLKAPFLLAWTLGRAMRARGEGAIVSIADWAGDRPYKSYLPYCISKAGVVALTKALAIELAPAVRVNAVAPGPVLLPEHFGEREVAAVERATPLGVGTPEDVARAIRFLAEEATFTTGSVLHVDGGRGIA
jgi:NAD(P)-dependent dehydrogenase (short-subunit alcohol dehydrogenase family)